MKNLPKTTITGVSLAVSCSLSGLVAQAEASVLMPAVDEAGSRYNNLSAGETPTGVPSLNSLGLVAAAPAAATADEVQSIHSRLISGLSTHTVERYATQADALLVLAPSSDRQSNATAQLISSQFTSSQLTSGQSSSSSVASAELDLGLSSASVPSLKRLGLQETETRPAQFYSEFYSERLATPVSEDANAISVSAERVVSSADVSIADIETVETSLVNRPNAEARSLQVAQNTVVPEATVPSSAPALVAQSTSDTSEPLSDQEIRQQLLTTPNPTTEPELDVLDRRPQPIPSSSFITPNAYGADWGDFYIGSAGTTEDTDDGLDASASLGMGFGNAVDNVGVELNVGIISIDGFADDGSVGFKVHKLFPKANNLGVAVGWTNPITWGAAEEDEDTIYGVVTQRFDLRPDKDNPVPLTTSLGVGTGAFRSTGAIEAGDNAPNIFGSVGVRVIPQVSLVSSWSGRALGLATSAAPFNLPVVFTAGVSDLTDNTEEGTQFVGGLGYSFGF